MVTGSPSWVEEIQEVLPPEVPTIPLKTSPFDAVETVVFGFRLTVEGAMNGTVVVGVFLGELPVAIKVVVDENLLVFNNGVALGVSAGELLVTVEAMVDETLLVFDVKIVLETWVGEFLLSVELMNDDMVAFGTPSGTLNGGNCVIQDATCKERLAFFHHWVAEHAAAVDVEFAVVVIFEEVKFESRGGNCVIQEAI